MRCWQSKGGARIPHSALGLFRSAAENEPLILSGAETLIETHPPSVQTSLSSVSAVVATFAPSLPLSLSLSLSLTHFRDLFRFRANLKRTMLSALSFHGVKTMRKLLAKYPSMLSLCFIGASSSPPSPTMLYAFPSSQSHRSTTFALCTAHLLARTWAVSVASYLPGTLLFSAPLPPSTPMRTMMWSKRAQESWLAGVKAATAGVVSFPGRMNMQSPYPMFSSVLCSKVRCLDRVS